MKNSELLLNWEAIVNIMS